MYVFTYFSPWDCGKTALRSGWSGHGLLLRVSCGIVGSATAGGRRGDVATVLGGAHGAGHGVWRVLYLLSCPLLGLRKKGGSGGGRWVVMAAPCSEAMLSLVASAGRLGRNKVCVCVSISSAPKAGDLSQVTIFIGAVEDTPHTLFVENTARNSNACNQQGV